jgi:chromosome segregation ATPase
MSCSHCNYDAPRFRGDYCSVCFHDLEGDEFLAQLNNIPPEVEEQERKDKEYRDKMYNLLTKTQEESKTKEEEPKKKKKRKAEASINKTETVKKSKAVVVDKDSNHELKYTAARLKWKLDKREEECDGFSKQLRKVNGAIASLRINANLTRKQVVRLMKGFGLDVSEVEAALPNTASISETVAYHDHTMSLAKTFTLDVEPELDHSDCY